MSRIIALKENVEKALKDESKPWTRYLDIVEKKFSVDRLYIFVGKK